MYKTNECWINTIYDFYHETLLDPKKPVRYRITRDDILEILGKTKDSIKEGLTIHEVAPFFEKSRLKLRVYDIFQNLVFKYDPPVDHRDNPPMFCMFHEKHIYTLNHDLTSLAHKKVGDAETGESEVKVAPPSITTCASTSTPASPAKTCCAPACAPATLAPLASVQVALA